MYKRQPAYITKICNQIDNVASVIRKKEWVFRNQTFLDTILLARENDIIYCDPPYFGRYVDYYNGWTEDDEFALYEALCNTKVNPAVMVLLSISNSKSFAKL